MSLDAAVKFEDFVIPQGSFDAMPERRAIIEALQRDLCPSERILSDADRQCFDIFIAASRRAIDKRAHEIIEYANSDTTAGMIDSTTAYQLAEGQIKLTLEELHAAALDQGVDNGDI